MHLAPTCPLDYKHCASAKSLGPHTAEVRATHAALLGTRVWDSWAKDESGEPLPAPRLKCSSLMPWQRPRGVAKVCTARAV